MADNALEGMIRKAHHWPQRHRATEKTWPRISRIRRKQAGGFVPVFASCSLTTYTVCDRRKFVAKKQRDAGSAFPWRSARRHDRWERLGCPVARHAGGCDSTTYTYDGDGRRLQNIKSMVSKNTRIAYLKRMLKRLEGEETKIQQLVSTGELSPEGGELAAQQVRKSRGELLSELQKLEK